MVDDEATKFGMIWGSNYTWCLLGERGRAAGAPDPRLLWHIVLAGRFTHMYMRKYRTESKLTVIYKLYFIKLSSFKVKTKAKT